MSAGFDLVFLDHKGRMKAINRSKVAYVDSPPDASGYTRIWFSGREGDYAYVSGGVDDVIARLQVSPEVTE